MDSFTLGLLVPAMGNIGYIIGVSVDIIIVGIFILLGYFAGTKKVWPYVVGTILYALDAVIFVISEDFLSVFFHILMLVILPLGIRAVKKLVQAEEMLAELDRE